MVRSTNLYLSRVLASSIFLSILSLVVQAKKHQNFVSCFLTKYFRTDRRCKTAAQCVFSLRNLLTSRPNSLSPPKNWPFAMCPSVRVMVLPVLELLIMILGLPGSGVSKVSNVNPNLSINFCSILASRHALNSPPAGPILE